MTNKQQTKQMLRPGGQLAARPNFHLGLNLLTSTDGYEAKANW